MAILPHFHTGYLGVGACRKANVLHSLEVASSLMQQDQAPSGCTSFLFCPALNVALAYLVGKLEASNTWTAACCSHSLPNGVMLPVLHSASWDGTRHKESNAGLLCSAWCFQGCLMARELQVPDRRHWCWLCQSWAPRGLPLPTCR